MTLDNMVSALQQLKRSKELPCRTEDPKDINNPDIMTEDLIENLIALVEFVEDLPSDLEQCKEKIHSVSYDSDLFNGAINQGLDRAISCVDEFINGLKNPNLEIQKSK